MAKKPKTKIIVMAKNKSLIIKIAQGSVTHGS